jgi:hypothetical protein
MALSSHGHILTHQPCRGKENWFIEGFDKKIAEAISIEPQAVKEEKQFFVELI